jgi:CHAT domain-containing protein
MANSGGGALPHAGREVSAIGRLLAAEPYVDAEATRDRLRTQGATSEIVHLAAHGRFRADAPLFSALDLADGPLTTADVFALELPASLVTLSACQTGVATVGGGDELVGIARAFLYAGAKSLLVSQWRVDDEATAGLMQSFYQELAKGAGKAKALQLAQRKIRHEAMPQNRWSNPFFWAGFQLIGDDQGMGPLGKRKAPS